MEFVGTITVLFSCGSDIRFYCDYFNHLLMTYYDNLKIIGLVSAQYCYNLISPFLLFLLPCKCADRNKNQILNTKSFILSI